MKAEVFVGAEARTSCRSAADMEPAFGDHRPFHRR